jgi:hypothetical protein|tara:strand:- start:135 stop:335 length:201 start_codon:yes stop_codon:yes gene_type:complete
MTTVKSVQMMTKRKLLAIKGLSEAKVEKILSVAKKLDGKTFLTGNELKTVRCTRHSECHHCAASSD